MGYQVKSKTYFDSSGYLLTAERQHFTVDSTFF